MPGETALRDCLLRQFSTAWKLLEFHLDGLTTEACLWRPVPRGPHVRPVDGGAWRADWPEDESYSAGPPSIAWITWHIGYWWALVLDRSFGDGNLDPQQISWPGSADAVRQSLDTLREQWLSALTSLDDAELLSSRRTRWPYSDRPFADVVGWASIELTKNAAELGYVRFLFANRGDA